MRIYEEPPKLHHDQINAAYKKGIKRCIEIMLDDKRPAKVTAMTELLKELYC